MSLMLPLLIFVTVNIPKIQSLNLSDLSDLQKIEKLYTCDPGCWFREPNITSNTIQKWPQNCTEVCGVMNFVEDADVSVFDLQGVFKNLKTLKGTIGMSGTEYASIEFLSGITEILCEDVSPVSISNNRNLEILNFGNLTNLTCDFYAYGNPRLDASTFCGKQNGMVTFFIYDNRKNCDGCSISNPNFGDLGKYRNCTSTYVAFALTFSDFTDAPYSELLEFQNIQNVTGGLAIGNVNIKDLSFLKSLEKISGVVNSEEDYDMSIYNCWNLTRFGIPKLKTLQTNGVRFHMKIENVHSDFCLTSSEMQFFMDQRVVFGSLTAKFCENETTACIFDTMKVLEQNCSEILGDVTVESGDEEYAEKLKKVKNIWGSLTIQNTSFSNFSFLESLEYVALLNSSSIPLRVISNQELQSVSFPNLKRVFSMNRVHISFEDNAANSLNSSACMSLTEQTTETAIVVDGLPCEAIDRVKDGIGKSSRDVGQFLTILILILVLPVPRE